MAINFDGGLTCSFSVTDLNRSVEWYEKILGFKMLYRVDEIAWCELQSNVSRVNIGLGQSESVSPKGGATLTFGVKDIEEAKAFLDAHKIKQDGPIQELPGLVKLITFYDPDHNALMFYQELPRE
jgi:catechol 2,3-dioxygenase-like lactoylglutathione lyase family enzyme